MSKKTLFIILFLIGLLTILPQACENNNELDLYGVQVCDTTNVTWDSKIAAILKKNCVECHGKGLSYNGVRHDSYAAELKVVNDGRLRRVINESDPSKRMPKDRGRLPDCELSLINKWLDNGAPEN